MESSDLDDLYGDAILDHCRHPRNHDELPDPDLTGRAVNPFCGDEVSVQMDLDDGHVSRVGVQGVGCSINQATASMLSEAIPGKTLKEIEAMSEVYSAMMGGEASSGDDIEHLGHLVSLSGVRQYPVRIKCALLAWSAVEEAIEDYRRDDHT